MKENGLYIWGKNYTKPQLIKEKVIMAAAGENHFLFMTSSRKCFGMGSNRFGQLGLKQPQFYKDPVLVFQGYSVKSFHCGAEHSFFIDDRNEVYGMGLNVKGQLGLFHFQNVGTPSLVIGLLPNGKKNPKAANPALNQPPKSPIIQVLEKFDLQVKIDDPNQKTFMLQNDEHIALISCGALFSVALSSKSKIYVAGLIGGGDNGIQDQIQRTRFKQIDMSGPVQRINTGLSGAAVMMADGSAFFWGRFGKLVINKPRRVQKEKKSSLTVTNDKFADVQIGDQCAFALTNRGQILAFGQNIDGQLGIQRHQEPFREHFGLVQGLPFASGIIVGRNRVFVVDADKDTVYGWGSNRYGQIALIDSLKGILPITNLKFKLSEGQSLIASSYFTLFLSPRSPSHLFSQLQQTSIQTQQQKISKTQYKKLLQDYQLLKVLNMTLLQKNQVTKKQHKQVQTTSKFQISGINQYRKFNSNIEIGWKELQIQSQISQGGYGIIYRAKWREIHVVVKKFKIENGDVSLRDFLSECNAMEAVRHPSIVMFLGAVTTKPNYSIILEYCSKGSLWSYLQNRDNTISWEQRRRFALQIAQGVLYLHLCSPPILHRDLKSLNIFLDINLRIKIGDFGWTKALEEYMTNKIGTYQWMAPQVIGSKPYSEKADVFSYSIIMWEIAAREPPYRNIHGTKVSEEVLNRQLRPTVPAKTPQAWSKLMKKCWDSQPNRRPTFRQIIRDLQTMKLA